VIFDSDRLIVDEFLGSSCTASELGIGDATSILDTRDPKPRYNRELRAEDAESARLPHNNIIRSDSIELSAGDG